MTAPQVAIVTPVFNGERYLRETMECVQAQTYENLVHVVLDNASKDATPDIISRYAGARTPLITARNNETVPLTQNWERAIALAPPEAAYIRILCADDLMKPACIERTAAIGAANPKVGVIGCGFQVMDEVQPSKWPDGITILPGQEAARRYFMGEGEFIGPHLMFRADLFKSRRPFYDARYNGIDTEAAFYCLQQSDWGVTTEILGWTRVHEESVSHTKMHAGGDHFIDWMRYIKTYGAWAMSREQRAAHERAFRRYYLRRMAHWARWPGGLDKSRAHLKFLRDIGDPAGPLDFIDAFADVILKRLKLRAPTPAGFPLG